MCHYITAVLPKSAAIPELEAIVHAHGRQLRPLSNPSITAQIGADERYFVTTTAHCDCGTPLGAIASAARRVPDWAAEQQRLARKGWSKAKIARAMQHKQEDFSASLQASIEFNRKAISPWLNLVRAVLASGKTSHLGLLLHFHSGPLEGPIALLARKTVRSTELTGDLLGQMQEDVLYVFQP